MHLRIIFGYLCFGAIVGLYLAALFSLVSWPWVLLSLPLFLASYKLLGKEQPYDFNDDSDAFPYTLGDSCIGISLDFDAIDLD